ncbi:hypothetical protein PINS_up006939 [Pythium insidiosum]|nr:hypothetical protein PINS_up006939 [Pythium insidiosum]
MEVEFDGQNAFQAAANGDFPLVVLLWGMAIAVRPEPVDLLSARDENGNSVLHYAASTALDGNVSIVHFLLQQTQGSGRDLASVMDARNAAGETPLMCVCCRNDRRSSAPSTHSAWCVAVEQRMSATSAWSTPS